MTRYHLAAILLCVPMAAAAADDFKISQLETDVRDLQRQVQAQSQQINELRSQLTRPQGQVRQPSSSSSSPTPAAVNSGTWLDASKWQRVRAGMTELDVVGLLGPPTSMRTKDTERVLFYAMEIGSSGFLSGSVTLHDRVVLEVQVPALR
jgi:outer membrane murein-binding lipoprotein Lpp